MKIIEVEKQFTREWYEINEELMGQIGNSEHIILMNYIGELQDTILHQQKIINKLSRKIQNKNRKIYDLENKVLGSIEYIEKRMIVEQFFNLDIEQCGELLEILRGDKNEK